MGHDVPWLIDEVVPRLAAVVDDVALGGEAGLDGQLSRRSCQMFSTGVRLGTITTADQYNRAMAATPGPGRNIFPQW